MADQPPATPAIPVAFRGGVAAARAALQQIDPLAYGTSRNHLDGAVTRLSPYIRHGVLTLAEVREAVFAWLRQRGYASPERRAEGRRLAGKLISELGWRDYWQRLWLQLGDGIWHDLEPLKTGHPACTYAPELPAYVAAAATGLACMDAFAGELMARGWLHNHARLWLASYLVHWRRVRWQAGARWFLQHLLDGDPASNNLSWQWVASSFSSKPYVFNRANLERFGGERHCRACALAGAGCPFEASYEELQARLFAPVAQPAAATGAAALPMGPAPSAPGASPSPAEAGPTPRRPLLWIHDGAVGPANPALRAHPAAPALFVLERELLAGRPAQPACQPLAPGRLRFLRASLAELPVAVREGDAVPVLLAAARAAGADGIVTSRSADPRLRRMAAQLAVALPVSVLEPEPFVALPGKGPEAFDLRRFSRYWRVAEPLVWACW